MFQHLTGRRPDFIDGDLYRKYAVLVPFLPETEELLFQVRAKSLNRQPGEVCFPGGRIEAGESPREAAVRETVEELLVPAGSIEVLAPLDILVSAYASVVHPYLAVLRDYGGTFSPSEVQEVFRVPLWFFLDNPPRIHKCRVTTEPADADFPYDLLGVERYPWGSALYPVLFYEYQGRVIWGMTAKFVHNLVELYRQTPGDKGEKMELITERCTIRAMEAQHIDDFMLYRNNLDWMRYQGFKGLTRREYEEALLVEQSPDKGMQLAILSNATGRLIGDIYLKRREDTFWVGYSVNPAYARRGYAREAVTAVIGWMRRQGAARVSAGVLPGNAASMGLLAKLGFAYVSTDEHGELIYTLDL